MQLRPFHLKIWPPGLVRDILSKFLPSQLPRNCSKPVRTLVIHGDMARHSSYPTENLKIHTPPDVKTGTNQIINTLHVIIDPNIFCMFRAGNSRFCTTFAENSNIFLRISRLGKPSEMPQIVEPRFSGPCL